MYPEASGPACAAREDRMRPKVPTARDIMTRSLVTLRPEMRALEAAGLLLKHEISGAPVVDDEGRLVGLFSEYDCLREVAAGEYDLDHHEDVITVGSVMNDPTHTISPEIDLFGSAHAVVNLRVPRLPVVEDGRLIGQVSRRDALRAVYELRRRALGQKHYPDYPEGREPIHFYPRRR
jgi:CBS domain-containing protein